MPALPRLSFHATSPRNFIASLVPGRVKFTFTGPRVSCGALQTHADAALAEIHEMCALPFLGARR